MTRSAAILRFFSGAAPWLSLLLLVALSQTLPNRVAPDGSAATRRIEIAAAMEAVPFFIGDWVGEDEAVPREAQKLLRPNAILSRRYRRPGGMWLHLLVVHCSDARDMIGHYPPICYPSAGWVTVPLPDPDVQLILDERPVPVRTYMFRRVRENGVEETIQVFNAFVLPDGTITREFADISGQSERLALSTQGVAQVQIIGAAGVDRAEALEAAGELLTGMSALSKALGLDQGAIDEA
jgi:hypothetical protein